MLSAFLLYNSRQVLLLDEQASTPFTRSLSFLHAPYLPKFYYFELFELTKKLILIGFASVRITPPPNRLSPDWKVSCYSCSRMRVVVWHSLSNRGR